MAKVIVFLDLWLSGYARKPGIYALIVGFQHRRLGASIATAASPRWQLCIGTSDQKA